MFTSNDDAVRADLRAIARGLEHIRTNALVSAIFLAGIPLMMLVKAGGSHESRSQSDLLLIVSGAVCVLPTLASVFLFPLIGAIVGLQGPRVLGCLAYLRIYLVLTFTSLFAPILPGAIVLIVGAMDRPVGILGHTFLAIVVLSSGAAWIAGQRALFLFLHGLADSLPGFRWPSGGRFLLVCWPATAVSAAALWLVKGIPEVSNWLPNWLPGNLLTVSAVIATYAAMAANVFMIHLLETLRLAVRAAVGNRPEE